jgi:hypothetical protein
MKISVVGNAASLFDKFNGHIIDSADMVVRFNGGVIDHPQCQGHKTTHLAYSTETFRNKANFGEVVYWDTNDPDLGFPDVREKLRDKLLSYPSNGVIVLERIKDVYPDAIVQLFGFDWMETHSWYPYAMEAQERGQLRVSKQTGKPITRDRYGRAIPQPWEMAGFASDRCRGQGIVGQNRHNFIREKQYCLELAAAHGWVIYK